MVDGATRIRARRQQVSSHLFRLSTGKPATAPKRAEDFDPNEIGDDGRFFNSHDGLVRVFAYAVHPVFNDPTARGKT